MEVYRASEALLRPHAQCLLTRTSRRTAQHLHPQCQHPARRAFTSAARRYDDQQTSPQRSTGANDDISSLLDSALDFNKGTPTASATRTSRFKSPSAQASNPPSRGMRSGGDSAYRRPAEGSSVDELMSAMGSGGRNTTSGQQQGRGSNSASSGFLDISRMLSPSPRGGPASASLRNHPPSIKPSLAPPEKSLGIKLNASVGRRVDMTSTVDPARAFRTLEAQCARNSVRKDFQRQRFHERPGLKRKRLKGERWRRRFREGFRGVVGLVLKMKKQGW